MARRSKTEELLILGGNFLESFAIVDALIERIEFTFDAEYLWVELWAFQVDARTVTLQV